MTVFLKPVAAAFAACAALLLTPAMLHAQESNNLFGPESDELFELFARQGFKMSEVHSFALSLGYPGQLTQLDNGELFGVYSTDDGRRFVAKPDFCNAGVCLGLVFASYYPTNEFSATYQQLNDFNIVRPHGNASYVADASTFVVQRIITNIGGVTIGGMAGEFGTFEGYSSAFDTYMRDLTGAANVAFIDDAGDANSSDKVENSLGAAANAADSFFGPSNAAREILADHIAKGSASEIYFRPVAE